MKIGHTTKTTLILADTYASSMNENLTVHSGSFSIPAGLKAGDWVTIPLSSAFTYDPTKNLAVLFSTTGGAGFSSNVRRKNTSGEYPGRVAGGETGGSANPEFIDDGILEIKLNLQ